jgi:CRP-like cAMP-binding protein
MAECQAVEQLASEVLYNVGDEIDFLYFPNGSVISLVTEMEDGRMVEAGTVGLEGIVGLQRFLGAHNSAHRVVVQVPGKAARMPSNRLETLLSNAPVLRARFAHFADAMMVMMSQSAACIALHPVHERCARWLLHTADRTGSNSFRLTHEFLAAMLGVHRPTVTIAAGMLQQAGLIEYHRGRVEILDQRGLLAASCECYGVITRSFERAIESLD